jgi:hypothetical protein
MPFEEMGAWQRSWGTKAKPSVSHPGVAERDRDVRFVPILLQKSAMTGAWPVA